MKVVIYSGIPGAGKSHHISRHYQSPGTPPAAIYSSDFFFYQRNARYDYDPTRQGDAHAWNLRRYIEVVRNPHVLHDDTVIIVDNTNTTVAELAPYWAAARAYDHHITLRTIFCEPDVALRRNVHDVPAEVVLKLAKQLEERVLPSWMSMDKDELRTS